MIGLLGLIMLFVAVIILVAVGLYLLGTVIFDL